MANVTREQLQSIEWAVRDASDRQVTCPVYALDIPPDDGCIRGWQAREGEGGGR